MMAYVSNMTNGYCNYVFKQEVLTQQSAWEAERPVKPVLEKLFDGIKYVDKHFLFTSEICFFLIRSVNSLYVLRQNISVLQNRMG
jgi:hypothetical protein